jgi:preprotein translocase subunit SecA
MVTRRVEGAQKKIEERHFDQRKNLLEYDEVMDEQRKRTYSYRQRILDGVDCRELLIGMMDEQIERWVGHFLNSGYREQSIVEWASQRLNLELDKTEVHGMDRQQLEAFLRDQAERQYDVMIFEQLEINLPDEDEESRTHWNWVALTKWTNRYFGLNLNDKDLRKVERADLQVHLMELAKGTMDRWDLADLDLFLDNQFELKSLCGWAHYHFTLQLDPEELASLETAEIEALLKKRVRERYDEKEYVFPVSVGLHSFLTGDGQSGEKYNREKLARWANTRFRRNFEPEQFAAMSNTEIESLLIETSKDFLLSRPDSRLVEARLLELLPDSENEAATVTAEQAEEVAKWASSEIKWEVDKEVLQKLKPAEARNRFLQGIEQTFRPEMRQTERSVLLEILDTAWKDHLYFMGHLRQGIGFVGYAQKDPKTEYKREGRKAFNTMWQRVGEQVTQTIFRIEQESPQFVGSLWQVTATQHDVAPPVEEMVEEQQESGPQPGDEGKTIDPIINNEPKVGRNDPCPCGSGKKYKKCCGK